MAQENCSQSEEIDLMLQIFCDDPGCSVSLAVKLLWPLELLRPCTREKKTVDLDNLSNTSSLRSNQSKASIEVTVHMDLG